MLNTGCTISVSCTVFKGCDFSLTLPTLVNLHFLDNSLSSVCEGVCRGFSLDGHNDDTIIFYVLVFHLHVLLAKCVYVIVYVIVYDREYVIQFTWP